MTKHKVYMITCDAPGCTRTTDTFRDPEALSTWGYVGKVREPGARTAYNQLKHHFCREHIATPPCAECGRPMRLRLSIPVPGLAEYSGGGLRCSACAARASAWGAQPEVSVPDFDPADLDRVRALLDQTDAETRAAVLTALGLDG